MCGIAGLFNSCGSRIDRAVIKRMTDAISHRGPDDEGFYIKNNFAMGHRRLSIIDLSGSGHQPMTFENSGLWIVYNGEIYNYIELRKELESAGFKFRTRSDTEVLLASYMHWGVNAFQRFNGMWAIAIYDEKRRSLLLCRDRYGIKPLYYYHRNGYFGFASEYKAFLAVAGEIGLDIDEAGFATAVSDPLRLESSGFSLLKGVSNLQPGMYLSADLTAMEISKISWWRTIDHLYDVPGDITTQKEMFFSIFEDSCRLRMRSDVPIGTSLSGGLDSSSVVSVLHRINPGNNITFVHRYPGSFLDETEYAGIVAESNGLKINYVDAVEEDFDDIDSFIYSFESIYFGMPDSPFRIYKSQRNNGIIVTLDGHGADEMLGGYIWYLDGMIDNLNPFLQKKRIMDILSIKRSLYPSNSPGGVPITDIREYQHKFLKKINPAIFLMKSAVQSPLVRSLKRLIKKQLHMPVIEENIFNNGIKLYNSINTKLPADWSYLQKTLYTDFHHTLLPRILRNFDLTSMANGIEIRMPFMDYRLVNFCFSLPDESRIGDGFTKNILRKAMEGILDDRVRLRKTKIGFNSPVSDLLLNQLKPWAADILESNDYDIDCINKKQFRKLYDQNIRSNHMTWEDALSFWKVLSALKLKKIFNEKMA
jgi:asparagine synthase (glutamine-hydrolysing)